MDTDLALEEEREAAARLREEAEEAAGGDTGYVPTVPTVPAPARAKGPPLGVVSVAALEAQQQLQRRPTAAKEQDDRKKVEEVALPIMGRRSEIAATIASHRVTIIEGETGCGKSTQVRCLRRWWRTISSHHSLLSHIDNPNNQTRHTHTLTLTLTFLLNRCRNSSLVLAPRRALPSPRPRARRPPTWPRR